MSYFDRCPDRWEAERQGRHDAESRYQDYGERTSPPHRYDCDDAQHSYEDAFRSEMYRQEERREEEEAHRAHDQRMAEERAEEERAAEEAYYQAMEQAQYDRAMAEEYERAMGEQPGPDAEPTP